MNSIEEAKLVSRISHFDSMKIVGNYIYIEYECAEWRDFIEEIFTALNCIELYAYTGDEYGLNVYYTHKPNAEKVRVFVDFEGEDFDEEISKIELGKWVASLPKEVTQAFPDFNSLDVADYILPEEGKNMDVSRFETDLFCYFTPPVTEERIRSAIPKKHHNFYYKKGENYCEVEWLPLSKKGKNISIKVLNYLADIENTTIYANEFYEGSSHPYKLYKVYQGGVDSIFDSNHYKEEELKFLTDEKDNDLGFKVNWFSLNFKHLIDIHESYGLDKYANERLKIFHENEKKELDFHEEIWEENKSEINPILKNLNFYLYFRNMEQDKVEDLSLSLIGAGMLRKSIASGIGYSGKNTLCGPSTLKEALSCLQNTIPALIDYRVVIDNDCDSVVINTY